MSRLAWWRIASLILIGALATRMVWLAWQYYFQEAPRYRVESAAIALVIAGLAIAAMRRDESPSDESAPASLHLLFLPVCIVAAIAIYAGAIGLGLLSDDYTLRAMAQSGLASSRGWFFRPLPLLLWRGLLAVFDTPVVLHLVNVLLHGVNAYLIATLGTVMGLRREQALGAAAIFLAFPALPEAVAWSAGIQDVLMTTMALAAVVVSARESVSGRRIAVVCVLFILGLLSKETAICIPALIALSWLTPSRMRADARLYVALVIVAIAYLAVRVPMGIGDEYLGSPSRYFFKQLIVGAFGTLATPWRAPLSMLDRAMAFTAVLVVVVMTVHAFLSWRRTDRRLQRDLRLTLWILASIAPVFTLFFVDPTLQGSRYLYLAAAAWSLIASDLLASLTGRLSNGTLVFSIVVAATVLVFAVSVQRELAVWRSAAELRDDVLTQARIAMNDARCERPTFANVPDSVNGAYVFRNGFPEALGLALPASNPACTLTWADGRFVLSR